MLTCKHCDGPIVWHEGNGGQWIGGVPPRDWVTCHGSAYDGAVRHEPDLPSSLDPADLATWLDS